MRIFINYRRRESSEIAGRLAVDLRTQLSDASVFLDTDEPVSGPFPLRIARELKAAEVMLAIINENWLDTLQNEEDWVRRELIAALETGTTVIPVLVNTDLPEREQLPSLLRPLVENQAVRLRSAPNRDWDSDVLEIVRLLKERKRELTVRPAIEDEPYMIAMYSALVRWIIYEAELSWRVTSAFMPSLLLLAGVGAVPFVLETKKVQELAVLGLTASMLGLLISILWYTMVARSRHFFKYRVDSAMAIENCFPVAPDRGQIFRNEFFRGHASIKANSYEFSWLERIRMTTGMKSICISFNILFLLMLLANLVLVVRVF